MRLKIRERRSENTTSPCSNFSRNRASHSAVSEGIWDAVAALRERGGWCEELSAARARARRLEGARCQRGKRGRSQPLQNLTPRGPTNSCVPFPFRPAFTVLGSTLTVYTRFRRR